MNINDTMLQMEIVLFVGVICIVAMVVHGDSNLVSTGLGGLIGALTTGAIMKKATDNNSSTEDPGAIIKQAILNVADSEKEDPEKDPDEDSSSNSISKDDSQVNDSETPAADTDIDTSENTSETPAAETPTDNADTSETAAPESEEQNVTVTLTPEQVSVLNQVLNANSTKTE